MGKTRKAPKKPVGKRSEAEILHPEQVVRLADGRDVTVRELAFAEAVRFAAKFDALATAVDTGGGGSDALVAALADDEIRALWSEFIALVTGIDAAAFEALPVSDGFLLTLTAYRVNAGFFGVLVGMSRGRRENPPTA